MKRNSKQTKGWGFKFIAILSSIMMVINTVTPVVPVFAETPNEVIPAEDTTPEEEATPAEEPAEDVVTADEDAPVVNNDKSGEEADEKADSKENPENTDEENQVSGTNTSYGSDEKENNNTDQSLQNGENPETADTSVEDVKDEIAVKELGKSILKESTLTTQTVSETDVVKIGDILYSSLEAAISNASSGDEIIVLKDFEIGSVRFNKTLTLDLNGKTINSNINNLIRIESSGDLTITGSGTINGPTNGEDFDQNVVVKVEGGKLTYLNGRLNTYGDEQKGMYGVYVKDGGTAIFGKEGSEEGPIINSYFSAIATNNTTAPATIIVYGGTYENASYPYAYPRENGAIYVPANGTYNIIGGTLKGDYGISIPYKNVNETIIIGGDVIFDTNIKSVLIGEEDGRTETPNRTIKSTSNSLTLPEGYVWEKQEGGTYKAVPLASYVAEIDGVLYETLSAAIAAVPTDGTETTVKLLKDVNGNIAISNNKNIVLDLNEKTVTNGFSLYRGNLSITNTGVINGTIYSVANQTSSNVGDYNKLVIGSGVTVNGSYPVILYQNLEDITKGYGCQIDIYGNVNGTSSAIWVMGNIKEGNSVINVYGTLSGGNLGIAQNGYSTVNVYDGASIYAQNETAFEQRAGTTNIYGGSIKSDGTPYNVVANGNGTTTVGAAFAVSPYNLSIQEVNIYGGDFEAEQAFVITNTTDGGLSRINSVNLSGGNFSGAITSENRTTETNIIEKFISGGTFSSPVAEEYCAAGLIPNDNGDGTFGVKIGEYVAQIGSEKYETLEAAITAANDGDTITLLKNVENVKDLDLSNTITIEGEGDVTIKAAANSSNSNTVLGTVANGKTVTFSGVKFDLSEVKYGGAGYAGGFNLASSAGGNVGGKENVGKVAFNNCTFDGRLTVVGEADFNKCNFNYVEGEGYLVEVRSREKVAFTGCEFSGYDRGVNIYDPTHSALNEGAEISFNTCNFEISSGSTKKGAIVVHEQPDSGKVDKFNVVITNCTADETYQGAGKDRAKVYSSGLVMVDDLNSTIEVSGGEVKVSIDTEEVYSTPRIVHTITFVNSGTVYSTSGYHYGDKLVAPTPAPIKTGYTFTGWYKTGLVEKWDFENDIVTGAETLYSNFEADTYTVTYKANGGSGEDFTGQATFGGNYIISDNQQFTREGYTFSGWNTQTNGEGTDYATGSSITWKFTGDLTLYAQWTEVARTVNSQAELVAALAVPTIETITIGSSFDVESSVIIDRAVTINGNNKIISMSGNQEWVSGGHSYIFKVYPTSPADIIIKDLKLTHALGAMMVGDNAKVEVGNVDVSGNIWGGVEVKNVDTASLSGNLIINDEKYEKPVAWVDSVVQLSTVNLLGATSGTIASKPNQIQYYLNPVNLQFYTITFDTNSGSAVEAMTGIYDATITLPYSTRDGYTFSGWKAEDGTQYNSGASYTISGNATLTGVWDVIKYTITYHLDDGIESAQANVTEYTIESDDVILATPIKTGYTFLGWTGGSHGSTLFSGNTVAISKGTTENKEFTANWEINQYKITFDTDGGTDIAPITQDYNTSVTVPTPAPTKTGYQFSGWNPVVPTTMPAENITITGEWNANIYTVNFESGGATSGSMNPQIFTYADATTSYPLTANVFEKIGHTFSGWTDGTNKYADGADIIELIKANSGTLDLTAEWKANPHTLIFVVDGVETTGTVVYGADITAPADPTKDCNSFAGWTSSVDGLTTTGTMPDSDVTFTANWNYTCSKSSGGGGGGGSSKPSNNMQEVVLGGEVEVNTGDEAEINTGDENKLDENNDNDENKGSIGNTQGYDPELVEAYKWAYANGITTMPTIEQARLKDGITRAELAKMMVVFMSEVLHRQPVITETFDYPDVNEKALGDLTGYIQLAYQYQIMGIQADGKPLNKFNPRGKVSRAEFATVLSRVLYGSVNNQKGANYREKHIEALNKAGILTNTDPKIQELRGWIILMLYRSQNSETNNEEESTAQVTTGDVAEVESGSAVEVATGATAEIATGEVAQVTTGDVAEVESGSAAEVTTGTTAEIATGTVVEANTGSVAQTAIAGANTGDVAKVESGSTAEVATGDSK